MADPFNNSDYNVGHVVHNNKYDYNKAVGHHNKSKKKYFTKTKEDKVKESPLLKLRGHSFISPWVFVGLEDRDRTTFVQTYVLSYLKTTIDELKVKSKKRELVIKKKVFLYAMREYGQLKLEYVGNLINTDHANALHHINDVKGKLDIKDKEFVDIVSDLDKVLKNNG